MPSLSAVYILGKNQKKIETVYEVIAQDGLSSAPPAEDEGDHHYICFAEVLRLFI